MAQTHQSQSQDFVAGYNKIGLARKARELNDTMVRWKECRPNASQSASVTTNAGEGRRTYTRLPRSPQTRAKVP